MPASSSPRRSPEQRMSATKLKVLFVRPLLGQGGADRVTVTVLQHLDRERFEPHLALLRAEGVWIDRLPGDVGLHPLNVKQVRAMLPRLVSLIRRLKPDVVFSTASGTNASSLLAARLSGCNPRVVVSERNILLNGGYRPKIVVQMLLKALSYRFAHRVTAVSGGVADDLASKLRLRRDDIDVLYNPSSNPALRAQAAEPVDHPWLTPGNRTVVAAGRLVPWKGYPDLIRAFSRVFRTDTDARLLILGEGEELARLQQLVAEEGLSEVVAFLGFQKNPYKYFAKAAVFAMASYNEGLCNVLIEAMSCGAPVVATNCPSGQDEIVSSGKDGILVPVGDIAALAANIQRLLSDRELAAALSREALRKVEKFSLAAVMSNYERAIARAVSPAAA